MFKSLTDGLNKVFNKLKSRGILKEADIDEGKLKRTARIDIADQDREENHEDADVKYAGEKHQHDDRANALALPNDVKPFFDLTEPRGTTFARCCRV